MIHHLVVAPGTYRSVPYAERRILAVNATGAVRFFRSAFGTLIVCGVDR
jgi:hypothetical protein